MIQNRSKTFDGIIKSGHFNEPYNRHSINIQYALTRADEKNSSNPVPVTNRNTPCYQL